MSFDLVSFAIGFGAAFLLSLAALGIALLLSRPKRHARVPVQQLPPAVLLTPGHTAPRPRKKRA